MRHKLEAITLSTLALLSLFALAQAGQPQFRITDPTQVTGRSIVGSYWACSAGIAGAAGAQNLISLHAPNGNTTSCFVKQVIISLSTAASTGILTQRTSGLPSGGTALTPLQHKTGDTAATCLPIQAPTATATGGSGTRDLGSAGKHLLINALSEYSDITIAPNAGLLILTDAGASGTTFTACIQWDEGTGG